MRLEESEILFKDCSGGGSKREGNQKEDTQTNRIEAALMVVSNQMEELSLGLQ